MKNDQATTASDELNKNEVSNEDFDLTLTSKNRSDKRNLRTGYTTGTSAAAATSAALKLLLLSESIKEATVHLPNKKQALLKIVWTRQETDGSATAAVIKDGGDDPDVTNGVEICSTVSLTGDRGVVEIEGGPGVGRVTKPGLGLEIGRPAINKVPKKMIEQVVHEIATETLTKNGIRVTVSVPNGEQIAKKTDNPRLGIVGGISILGTTGIVFPYSTASFAASIKQSIDVSVAMGSDTVVLSTGSTSEEYAKVLLGNSLAEHSFIQIGDFIGYAIRQCVAKKITKAIVTGFIGKFTKMAMGVSQTHVKGSHVDLQFMAALAAECDLPANAVAEIEKANTARHAGEIVRQYSNLVFFDNLSKKVFEFLQEYSNYGLEIEIIMFEFDGTICSKYPKGDLGI
ncbi:MAG TPA: cobalt-precorrin-5B (C(1))-methyltransferase [Nitrososphaeraceae archaeon]|jgi:cobalt-precorrin-5B (C1)-methyltransferase